MPFDLKIVQVGPWPMNTYIVIDRVTNECAIVDPGADERVIIKDADGMQVDKILITHGHPDHVGALDEIRKITGAPVYINPLDAEKYKIQYDVALMDNALIPLGNFTLRAIHTPGHTPGMTCFDLGDYRIIVGDTIFVGGPGKTWSSQEFKITMQTMQDIVFKWPDKTVFYPGHGPAGMIGQERSSYETFVRHGWTPDTFGDITWAGGG